MGHTGSSQVSRLPTITGLSGDVISSASAPFLLTAVRHAWLWEDACSLLNRFRTPSEEDPPYFFQSLVTISSPYPVGPQCSPVCRNSLHPVPALSSCPLFPTYRLTSHLKRPLLCEAMLDLLVFLLSFFNALMMWWRASWTWGSARWTPTTLGTWQSLCPFCVNANNSISTSLSQGHQESPCCINFRDVQTEPFISVSSSSCLQGFLRVKVGSVVWVPLKPGLAHSLENTNYWGSGYTTLNYGGLAH